MKIAYVIGGLHNSGGMERVISCKANWLAQHTNYSVTIITYRQNALPDYFDLLPQVRRINICLGGGNLYKHLKAQLFQEHFDICISTYGEETYVLPMIKDGSQKIVEFHFSFMIKYQWESIRRPNLWGKMLATVKTARMIWNARRYDKIVVLSKADLHRWQKFTSKVVQIYNPITIVPADEAASLQNKQAIAVGRIDPQKGFDYLIECWRKVVQRHPDWKLNIFGGGNASAFVRLAKQYGIADKICFRGVSSDITKEYLNSSVFILSSRWEGFPLVLVEAVSCGLPVVSFDCPSGPSELIEDGSNGFLIDRVGDIDTMAERICRIIEDTDLRIAMGKNAKEKIKTLAPDVIMQEWVRLFSSLLTS